jgi:cysteinyl-tRNA synthetase
MSKSEGNVILVKDLTIDANVFRLFTLSTHYRAPIQYTEDVLDNYTTEWDKIHRVYRQLFVHLDLSDLLGATAEASLVVDPIRQAFQDAMDLDFNTPNAITALQDLVKTTNQLLRNKHTEPNDLVAAKALFDDIFEVFGLRAGLTPMEASDKALYHDWVAARAAKDFAEADRLRDLLQDKGILG